MPGFPLAGQRRCLFVAFLACSMLNTSVRLHAGELAGHRIDKGSFRISYDDRGVTDLAHPQDPFGAQILAAGKRLGVTIRWQVGDGKWQELDASDMQVAASPETDSVSYLRSRPGDPLKLVQTFKTDGAALDWTIDLQTTTDSPVRIGDLAISVPWQRPGGEEPKAIFERSFVKHHFISGHGSFLYFVRPSGAGPYLMAIVHPGTKLEYYSTAGGQYHAFIHSGLAGGDEKRGTWRQEHTFLKLGPAGAKDSKARCGFRFRWANSYDEMRSILFQEGLFDIRVVPGMTVPEDLSARFAIRTQARIEAIQPEFPAQTRLVELRQPQPGYRLYEVQFRRLGENRLTIHHDGDRQTHLEFFATEPIETLIRKRSDFIVRRQQHRDPSKWYDGLFSVYDMRSKVLRSPENTDGFDGWWGYVIAADDPALCKAPFVAAKNVHFPVRQEIAAVEYYVEHFVWGKLQRTDKETPYPYGIYGAPNWQVNRDPAERAKISKTNLDKMHVWRSFDYPHLAMLYFHLHEIAKKYPGMTTYLDSAGYLERAYQTARAYFLYPNEILPYYETYKWGCYNELVILSIVAALEERGLGDQAAWLRGEWEKKAKYFIYDDPYPFRSEYAFDRTAFESSYALAKYGATHDMKPDINLWYDGNLKKWYSHPVVRREDARAFMERQLAANVAVRGWLETAYYLLGADFTASSDRGALSYMAKMGGWAILDYGVNFAPKPYDWLQLGYASYLSSWALMNTGRAETGYGCWFPGQENDGAAGWQFMPAKFGTAWIRKDVPRGPWHYDGEIDLGFSAGLRSAATILTRDPLFDWLAYGGTLDVDKDRLSVVPRDGLRKRFHVVLSENETPTTTIRRLKIELDRDGFAAGQSIVVDKSLKKLTLTLENRTADRHLTRLGLSLPEAASYALFQDGRKLTLNPTDNADYPLRAELQMTGGPARIELVRDDGR